jgi:L-aminopeptidase/D-esterase-like protein
MEGVRVGHWQDEEKGTGCTVILLPEGNVTSAFLLGQAPGTREFALLSPQGKVEEVNAIFFTGGSAFGLAVADGIVEFLKEKGVGYPTPLGRIPIVPGAVIFDLNLGDPTAFPGKKEGYLAAEQASERDLREGNVGVGTGATVGKWKGMDFAMKGGWGVSEIKEGDVRVTAFSVVTAL